MRDLIAPARARAPAGSSYEYDLVHKFDDENTNKELAEHGKQGWRLAAVTNSNLYFERPLAR